MKKEIKDLTYKDLIIGNVYKYQVTVQQGKMKNKFLIIEQEYLGKYKDNYVFKTIKIHTPEVAQHLGIEISQKNHTGEWNGYRQSCGSCLCSDATYSRKSKY